MKEWVKCILKRYGQEVTVSTAEGDQLFALPVAWQEVADHG